MNETLQLIDRRTSLRTYADRPIEGAHVEAILESAMRAPTAGNMMLYSIVRVSDPEKKRALAETCGHAFIAEAPLVLLFLADMQRWVDFFDGGDVRTYCEEEGLEHRMPDPSKLLMSCCDAMVAAQNTVIAAESLGIGSCYIGDIMGHAEEHRVLFDLPAFALPITLLCYGYPPDGLELKKRERFDRKFIIHQDAYVRSSTTDLDEMMRDIRKRFSRVLKERGLNLPQLTYKGFMAGAAALEERRSVGLLLEPWLDAADKERAE